MLPDLDATLPRIDPATALTQVETFLAQTITALEPEAPAQPSRGRPRILPSLCLWLGLTVCILRGKRHQRDLWRLLAHGNLWSYPRFAISDQAVYNRLEGEGLAPLETLFTQITTVLQAQLSPPPTADLAPFATEIVALDEITLDKLTRHLPALRGLPDDDPALVGGTLAGLFDIRRQLWRHVAYRTDWRQNEKVLAREMATTLPAGSLILADLGYFAFEWFDDLTDADQFWISRLRQKISYEVIHTYAKGAGYRDVAIWLGAYRADRAKHAVRLVEFTIGATTYRYLTNVRDPHILSLRAIAGLYQRRWDIELAIKTVKRQLGVHLLWSSKPVVIQQQILAALILAQLLHAVRFEAAAQAGVDPFEVSLDLLVRYLPDFAARGLDPLDAFLTHARELGFIRPSTRTENRAPQVDPDTIRPLPPDLVLVRIPRYARRKCGPRPSTLAPAPI
jgi:hypothetical protein